MTPTLVFLGAAATVLATLVTAGGSDSLEVWVFAVSGGAAFGDLARRGWSERERSGGDATDWLMTAAFLAILAGAAYDIGRAPGALATTHLGVRAAGALLIGLGVWLRHRASEELRESFSVRLRVGGDQRLIDSGPYRRLRHPGYAALLGIALGTALAATSPFALAATLLVWLPIVWIRILREEDLLRRRFGEAYRAYAGRSWRLVPGVL